MSQKQKRDETVKRSCLGHSAAHQSPISQPNQSLGFLPHMDHGWIFNPVTKLALWLAIAKLQCSWWVLILASALRPLADGTPGRSNL